MLTTQYAILNRSYVNLATGYVTDVVHLGPVARDAAGVIHGAMGGTLCEVFEGPAYERTVQAGGGFETATVRDTLYMAVGTGIIEHVRKSR